ncbi:MAG: DUF4836 family protein [Chitinophagaceae bacterium]|nr:DUF4836 family protein [Chitinophagaceae bacterium]
MKIIKLTALVMCFALIITSCKKTSDQGKMIPKNAIVVVHVDSKSLLSKVSWDEIKQTNWYKEISSDTSVTGWKKQLLENPENSGIDIKGGFVFFYQKSNAADDGQAVFEGNVKDAKAFEQFNKNLDPASTSVKDGDVTMLTLKNKSVVGWNASKFVYVVSTPSTKGMPYGVDTLNVPAPPVNVTDKLSAVCKRLFALNPDSSLAKNEKFANLLSEAGDVHYWQNTEQIMNSIPQMGMLGMLKLDVFFKGNVSTATANFDNGKININQKMYAGKELTDMIEKYGGSKINTDMIKNIPSQNVTGLLVVNFKPEGIKEIIKLTGMDGMANMFLSQQGLTLDDFVKATKGDMLFAVTDLQLKKDPLGRDTLNGMSDNQNSKPDASYLFSLSIGDKASLDKIISAGKKMTASDTPSVKLVENDKYFVMGNKPENMSKYLSGGNSIFPFMDKLSGHPIAGFIDINKILTTVNMHPMGDSSNKAVMDASVKMWDNIYFMGGEMKDGALVMNTEINLLDKNTNSLKQLNQYFDNIAKVMMEKEKREKANQVTFDTIGAPPHGMNKVDSALKPRH